MKNDESLQTQLKNTMNNSLDKIFDKYMLKCD